MALGKVMTDFSLFSSTNKDSILKRMFVSMVIEGVARTTWNLTTIDGRQTGTTQSFQGHTFSLCGIQREEARRKNGRRLDCPRG